MVSYGVAQIWMVTTTMMKIMKKYNFIKEIVKWAPNDTQNQNNAHPINSPIDCDGLHLTNAQCHMVPIYHDTENAEL